jgi:hypothetical protein
VNGYKNNCIQILWALALLFVVISMPSLGRAQDETTPNCSTASELAIGGSGGFLAFYLSSALYGGLMLSSDGVAAQTGAWMFVPVAGPVLAINALPDPGPILAVAWLMSALQASSLILATSGVLLWALGCPGL